MPGFRLKTIYEASIPSLIGRLVDLSTCGTAGEIRFIDCTQVYKHNILRIYETGTLTPPSDQPYAAVSYVWCSDPERNPPSIPRPAFNAACARDGSARGEDIATAVLSHACAAALAQGCSLLWLDRLCIMQRDEEDKAWQIQQMHAVYARATLALILPAGINRLARIDERTPWIHRAWTLQELLAPSRSLVLLRWTHGGGTISGATPARVTEVVSRRAAVIDATDLLELGVGDGGKCSFSPTNGRAGERVDVRVRVFGGPNTPQAWATWGALRLKGSASAESAVWRAALMRTSSRPVDMVLSIMGLFDVSLSPRDFGKDDRIAATLALTKKILERGGRASWIGASFHLPPSKYISSFPMFPNSLVSGSATVVFGGEERDVSDVIDGKYMSQWWLRDAPHGTIDNDGYLVIHSQAVVATLTEKPRGNAKPGVANTSIELRSDGKTFCVKDLEGRKWLVDESKALSTKTKSMLVFVGMEGRMTSLTTYRFSSDTPVRAIAVQRHGEGKWHRVASFFLGEVFQRRLRSWETFQIAIGGPRDLTDEQLRVARRGEFKGELAFRVRDTSNMTMHPVRRKAVRP